jgi:hypothetical protein
MGFRHQLMEQEVARFFILFHQYNSYRQADWPCSFAVRDSLTAPWYAPLTRTFSSSVPRLLVCPSVSLFVCSSVRLFFCLSVRLFFCSSSARLLLCSSVPLFFCSSALRLFICLFCSSVSSVLFVASYIPKVASHFRVISQSLHVNSIRSGQIIPHTRGCLIALWPGYNFLITCILTNCS